MNRDNHHTQAVGDSTSELAQKNMAAQNISNEAVTNQLLPEFTEKILNLADQNRLRLPYDLKTPGYTGSMPESPMKIQPQKKELQFSDPMVTTYQIANRWRSSI
ncbi:uncharacterized protein LOC128999320 [Macrosteles quadrilineatus]|uniref:uncharacterized protein LOC128999320 n=1 Tax=Macrosteles quadrilineatus TaxID=74068 RepID=UPI0023E0FEAE|nr:uncharacterized protein LOC128999320 [Macrosteles quadrilineatus]